MVLSGNLRQAVCRAIDREEGGCLLPDYQCTKTRQPVAEVLWEKHPNTQVPPVENPTCTDFEEYREMLETVSLDLTEDDVTCVVSKLSGTVGTLGEEAIELINWFLSFGCTSEDLRVVVYRMAEWMANPPNPHGPNITH